MGGVLLNVDDFQNSLNEFLVSLKQQEKADTTIYKYRVIIDLFVKYKQQSLTYDISKEDIINYKSYLSKHYKPATVNNYIIILNKYLDYLNLNNFKVKTIKLQQKTNLNDVISKSEYERLLKCAKKLNNNKMYF